MSFSFYINNVQDVSLRQTFDELGVPNLVSEEGVPQEGWPELAHIYQDKVSARSIETAYQEGCLQVRIMAYSSLADFTLAIDLIKVVANKYQAKITPEACDLDDDELSLESFREHFDRAWCKDQCLMYLNMMLGMFKENPETQMTIYGTRAEFKIGPRLVQSLLEDKKNFAKKFFAAIQERNYIIDQDGVFEATEISLQDKSSKRATSLYTLRQDVETLLSRRVPYLEIANRSEPGQLQSLGQPQYVKYQSFIDAAGDLLRYLDEEALLTPIFSDEEWSAIHSKLDYLESADLFSDEALLIDLDSSDTSVMESELILCFNDHQWGLVSMLPVAVFTLIAGADGVIDENEHEAFQAQLLTGMVGESDIFQLAIVTSIANFAMAIEKMTELDGEGVLQFIALAYDIVRQESDAVSVESYGQALYTLAESVAKSSGGGFFGFGSKISKEEKQALSALSLVLNLN